MSILSWNCRGLGGSSTVRELKRLLRTQNPSVVFLCETKIGSRKFESIRAKVNMFGISVNAQGQKGGLAMLWKKGLNVTVRSYSSRFIDVDIVESLGKWRLTGIYGYPETHMRHETWNLLRRLAVGYTGPWMCIGDWNEILHKWECRGGRERPSVQINQFRGVIQELGLMDLHSTGYPFTWARSWKRTMSYRARLDRALVNNRLKTIWRYPRIIHLDTNYSDHLPILVILLNQRGGKSRAAKEAKQKRFKFESMWTTNSQVKDLVESVWSRNSSSLFDRLERCKEELQEWKQTFGNIFKEEEKLRERIADLKFERCGENDENINADVISRLQEELEMRLDLQEKHWHQRSKILWLKNGDKNTAYFHSAASIRRKSNQISGLKDDCGNWVEDRGKLHELITEYFKDLFQTKNTGQEFIWMVVGRITARISDDDFTYLSREFTENEVKEAVFQMHPLKAPGPDGFNPQFFQHYWGIVGSEVTNSIFQMLRDARIPQEENSRSTDREAGPLYQSFAICRRHNFVWNCHGGGGKCFCRNSTVVLFGFRTDGEPAKISLGPVKKPALQQHKRKNVRQIEWLGGEASFTSRNGDFMSVTVSANASYSWRSILWARDHIKEGIFWCIGNESLVESLIDKENKVWKEECLELFNEADAEAIRRIPLGSSVTDDFPRWPFSKHGNYTVKSGYNFLQHQKLAMLTSNSKNGSDGVNRRIWRKLWSLKIAPKVKIFCWRLLLNALPSYENLIKKKVQIDNICSVCSMEDGSLLHLFTSCPVARQIWALSFLGMYIKPAQAEDIYAWMQNVFESCETEIIEKFCILLWLLWKGRNDTLFNGEKLDPLRMLQKAWQFWAGYKEANSTEGEMSRSKPNVNVEWNPPPVGKWKINVDASSDENGNNGMGMIVRDSFGNFIFAKAHHVSRWNDVPSLEACAIKMACEWCKEVMVKSVVIEGDAQEVIRMLNGEIEKRDYSSIFVKEALQIAEGEDHLFCWAPRQANEAAHILANYARENPRSHEWHMDAPDFLSHIVVADMNHL